MKHFSNAGSKKDEFSGFYYVSRLRWTEFEPSKFACFFFVFLFCTQQKMEQVRGKIVLTFT